MGEMPVNLLLPSGKQSDLFQCPVCKMEKLKYDIKGTFTILMFTSNVMDLLVKRNNSSKVSAELCKHMKHQKRKNILVHGCSSLKPTSTKGLFLIYFFLKYNLKSEYTLLGWDKCLPSASHSHRAGEGPQGCESVNLLSLKYIDEQFYFIVSNFNQQTLHRGLLHSWYEFL